MKKSINRIVPVISIKRNKQKQIIRTVTICPAVYLSIFLILIISSQVTFAELTKKMETKDSWKEKKLMLDAYEYAWCGNSRIVFGDNKYRMSGGKGIFIYDLDKSTIENIANGQDQDQGLWDVSCTADDRYVVFVRKKDVIEKKKRSNVLFNVFIFDRVTKTTKRYEMKDVLMHLSPNANYVLGPDLQQGQKYILPGGKEVKLMPRTRGMLDKIKFTEFQWSDDEKKLFLFDRRSGSLTTYDIEKDKLDTIFIKIKGSARLGDMRITKDNKLYLLGLLYTPKNLEEDITVNLYLFDLEKPDKKPLLLVSDLEEEYLDMDGEGNLVYNKALNNTNNIKDCKYLKTGLYYLEKGKKQAQLLKEIKCNQYSYTITPKISKNGKGIIYDRSTGYKKQKEFTILTRK